MLMLLLFVRYYLILKLKRGARMAYCIVYAVYAVVGAQRRYFQGLICRRNS